MTNKFMRKIRELSDEELDSLESALRTERARAAAIAAREAEPEATLREEEKEPE